MASRSASFGQPPAAQQPQRHSAHGQSPAQHGHSVQSHSSPHGHSPAHVAEAVAGHFSPQRHGLHLHSGLHWHFAVGPAGDSPDAVEAVAGHFSPQRHGLHLHSGLHWHFAVGAAGDSPDATAPPNTNDAVCAGFSPQRQGLHLHSGLHWHFAVGAACTGQLPPAHVHGRQGQIDLHDRASAPAPGADSAGRAACSAAAGSQRQTTQAHTGSHGHAVAVGAAKRTLKTILVNNMVRSFINERRFEQFPQQLARTAQRHRRLRLPLDCGIRCPVRRPFVAPRPRCNNRFSMREKTDFLAPRGRHSSNQGEARQSLAPTSAQGRANIRTIAVGESFPPDAEHRLDAGRRVWQDAADLGPVPRLDRNSGGVGHGGEEERGWQFERSNRTKRRALRCDFEVRPVKTAARSAFGPARIWAAPRRAKLIAHACGTRRRRLAAACCRPIPMLAGARTTAAHV